MEEKLELTIRAYVRVSPENRKQVKYLIEKLAEVEAMSFADKSAIMEMTETFET